MTSLARLARAALSDIAYMLDESDEYLLDTVDFKTVVRNNGDGNFYQTNLAIQYTNAFDSEEETDNQQ